MRWPWSKKQETDDINDSLRAAPARRKRNKHWIMYCRCGKPIAVTKMPVPIGGVLEADNIITFRHAKKKNWKQGEKLMCRAGKECTRHASTTYSTRRRLIAEKAW